jgi:non-canonical (house-cleaning) NTP pyrophosphatase
MTPRTRAEMRMVSVEPNEGEQPFGLKEASKGASTEFWPE